MRNGLGFRIALLTLLVTPQAAHSQEMTSVAPDDPHILYSEYLELELDSTRARFTRLAVDFYANTFAPGARINFASDATHIRIGLDYLKQGASGQLALEVDGMLVPNPVGSNLALGVEWFDLYAQPTPERREFSVILPYSADVDFLGLRLLGGSSGLLSDPPPRPEMLYVAYGDSITNGTLASAVQYTYPYLIGAANDWSVINMGFSGQIVTPADGTALGLIDADLITIAIGTNDFWSAWDETTFKANYQEFLSNIRAHQPNVPIYVITPIWANYDGLDDYGITLEDTRRRIREIVAVQQATDRNLYLLEGYDMVPPAGPYYPDGIHPNDAGFALFAESLARFNLVRNGGFEWDGLWEDLSNSRIVESQPFAGERSLLIGPETGGAQITIGGLTGGQCYRLEAASMQRFASDNAWFGISFFNSSGMEIQKDEVAVHWERYQSTGVSFIAPEHHASSNVWVWKADDESLLHVDEMSITEAADCAP